jgi:hypothetical protein
MILRFGDRIVSGLTIAGSFEKCRRPTALNLARRSRNQKRNRTFTTKVAKITKLRELKCNNSESFVSFMRFVVGWYLLVDSASLDAAEICASCENSQR